MYIVDVSIIVVINSVVGDFTRVNPGLRSEVFVGIIETCVHNSNNDFRIAFLNPPCPRHIDQPQIPLFLKQWIVRGNFGRLCLPDVVELGFLDQWVCGVIRPDGV